MKLIPIVITSFANVVIGNFNWERVKAVVVRMDDKDLSGEEKRHLALKEIKIVGVDVAKWALNLAIELAVAWLRSK